MSTQDSKVDLRDAHLDDVILTESAHLDSFRFHRHLDERAQVRRRVEPEAREVAKLAEPELVEQLRGKRAVVEQVQPRIVLHERQAPRGVHHAYKRMLRDDLA